MKNMTHTPAEQRLITRAFTALKWVLAFATTIGAAVGVSGIQMIGG